MTGAPIITTFFYTDEERRFHATLGSPSHIWERGQRMSAIEAGMRPMWLIWKP